MGADWADRRLKAAAARAERAGDDEAFIDLAHSRYLLAQRTGRPDDGAPLAAAARQAASRFRKHFRSRGGRLWASQKLDAALGDFLADELADGQLDPETFRQVESLKARVLLDALHDPAAGESGFRQLSEHARELEVALMRFSAPRADEGDVTWSELRLASLLPIGGPWDVGERRALLDELEDEYKRAGLSAPPPADVASLTRIQQTLAPEEALVEYVVTRRGGQSLDDVWALVVTASSARVVRVAAAEDFETPGFAGTASADGRAPIDFTPLASLVVDARLAIRGGDEAKAAGHLRTLSRLLIQPLLEQQLLPSPTSRLIVVPHRMLHYVPYSALPARDDQPLTEEFALVLAPSATVWERLQSGARPPASRFVGVANPHLGYTKLPPLDESEKELEAIVRSVSLECDTRVAEEATESFLHDSVRGAGIVHVATHGDFPEDDALDMQRILLAADDKHDGPLHAEELRRLDLTTAELLVLSVCNGGLFRFGPGDEPYGLVPAALGAGARNVIGTLWPIEDDIGRLFMKEVYRDMLTNGPSEAIRRTALQFRDDGALIRQWAAFTVVGAGRAFATIERS